MKQEEQFAKGNQVDSILKQEPIINASRNISLRDKSTKIDDLSPLIQS